MNVQPHENFWLQITRITEMYLCYKFIRISEMFKVQLLCYCSSIYTPIKPTDTDISNQMPDWHPHYENHIRLHLVGYLYDFHVMYHKSLIFTNNALKTMFHLPTPTGCALLYCQWQLAVCCRIFNTNAIICPNTAKSHAATSSNILDRI